MAAGISPALLWRSIYILFLITSLAATATSFSFFYNFSNPATFSHGDLSFEGDAYIGNGSIILAKEQLTGNTTSRSGRVSYAYPVSLRSNDTGEVLGFSANFSFVINGSQSPIDIDTGGGLAFFLAPYPSRMPPNSEGGYLGLFNSTTAAGGDGWIVAVEMDSNRDHGWDDATMSPHIAVDVNKLHSGKNSYKAVDQLVDGVPYVFQVDYSDVTKDLLVVLRDSTAGVPLVAMKKTVDLSMIIPREVAMGISAATGSSNMATHHVLWWSYDTSTNRTINCSSLVSAFDAPGTLVVLDSPPPADTEFASPPSAGAGRCNRPVLVAIVVFAVLAIVTAAVVALLCLLSRSSYGSRNSFGLSDKIILPIYKIMLDFGLIDQIWWEWETVIFYFGIINTSIICHMRRMRYQNRLRIRWCRMRRRILFVHDYIPNGRLSDHLNSPGTLLTWPMRYKIALDVGSALEYLHSQSRPIPHGNIRTDNVMLDELFNASLGGFHESCTEENDLESQKASRSDVFSFGTFLLEVMCGRQIHGETAASLVERVWSLHDQGEVLDAADERLEGQFDREEVERVLLVGLWCAHPDHWQRPSIAEAMRSLRSEAPLPSFPPRTPEIFIDIERA
ncbi:unnamed protein product [Urochloa humidicola]